MTLLKISTGECKLKELHEFKNNNNDGFKTFIATLTDWFKFNLRFWADLLENLNTFKIIIILCSKFV